MTVQANLSKIRMVVTPWVYDELGNLSRCIYQE